MSGYIQYCNYTAKSIGLIFVKLVNFEGLNFHDLGSEDNFVGLFVAQSNCGEIYFLRIRMLMNPTKFKLHEN